MKDKDTQTEMSVLLKLSNLELLTFDFLRYSLFVVISEFCFIILVLGLEMAGIIYITICISVPVAMVLLGEILGGRKPSVLKEIPFECGIIPKETASSNFVIPYFGYALLFLVLDVDLVLFYFIIGCKISLFYFTLIFLFLLLGFLSIGFAYKIGVLKWD